MTTLPKYAVDMHKQASEEAYVAVLPPTRTALSVSFYNTAPEV